MSQTLDLSTLLRARRTAPLAPPPQPAAVPSSEQSRPNVANASLDTRCEVLRFLSVEDETGGVTEMWTQAGAYPCRIEEAGAGTESMSVSGSFDANVPYRVYLPKFAQVFTSDRLGVPGWFNIWQEDRNYNRGDRVILADFDGFVYQCTESGLNPSPELLQRWNRLEPAQFLEIVGIIDAVNDNDLLVMGAKDIEHE